VRTSIIIALPEESEGIKGYSVYLSGCGKVNATIATMEALSSGVDRIINFGTAGAVSDISGLVEVTGYVDRDMDVRPLGFKLGQTPFEEGVLIGKRGLVVGSGDSFAIEKPEIDCDIVDMEAYAIARVCKKYDVDFKCFKYISDNVDDNSASDWNENVKKGNQLFQELLYNGEI
jgi:adenosylhomocysteine nucleosidase|tara:strand:+ start:114 stop:635 length:522 start_codon:yes stop_codon:yes gene_type:complete